VLLKDNIVFSFLQGKIFFFILQGIVAALILVQNTPNQNSMIPHLDLADLASGQSPVYF